MRQILAEIITIGDEILYGQILDTNTRWISVALDKIGVKVLRQTAIGDLKEEILLAVQEAIARVNIVIITGGLGPTKDDITKITLAELFGMPLTLHTEALIDLESIFARLGRKLTPLNRLQAHLPKGCTKITNDCGTAPGMWFEQERKITISIPGVPVEMEAMMNNHILPKLTTHFPLPTIIHKVIHLAGIGESWLSDKINEWEDALPKHIGLAYLPEKGQVKLRLTGIGDNAQVLSQEIGAEIDKVLPFIAQYIYGYGDTNIQTAVGETLRTKHLTLAIAESCTGGYLSHLITSVAGCSSYYLGSVIAYQNEVKKELLGVSDKTLSTYGAVSQQTAQQMAIGVRKKFGSDIGISTTGIADPSGGTKEKPTAIMWMALSFGDKVKSSRIQLIGTTKVANIAHGAISVLDFIRQHIEKR